MEKIETEMKKFLSFYNTYIKVNQRRFHSGDDNLLHCKIIFFSYVKKLARLDN